MFCITCLNKKILQKRASTRCTMELMLNFFLHIGLYVFLGMESLLTN